MRIARYIVAIIAALFGAVQFVFGAGVLHDIAGLLAFIIAILLIGT